MMRREVNQWITAVMKSSPKLKLVIVHSLVETFLHFFGTIMDALFKLNAHAMDANYAVLVSYISQIH